MRCPAFAAPLASSSSPFLRRPRNNLPRTQSPHPRHALPISRILPRARAQPPARQHVSPNPLFGGGGGGGAPAETIIVFGGASALGVEIARMFSAAGWRVVSLDFYDSSVAACGVNGCALPSDPRSPVQVALPSGASPRMQVRVAMECLKKAGVAAGGAAVVVNATLGYATGGISDDDLFDTLDYVYHTSVESSLVCGRLASEFLATGGMVAMLGSVAALSAQPKALNFSLCKAAVHQMVKSLALTVGDELAEKSAVLALVPEVLDTPLHRSMNQGVSAGHWTPCDAVASKLLEWASESAKRPPNASLVSISSSLEDKKPAAEKQHQFRLIDNPSFVQSTPL